MEHLALRFLGPFQAALAGEPVAGFASNKVRALLVYLAVEANRPHPRERLAGLLWAEWPEKEARGNLRHALANLRTVIGDRQVEPSYLCISRQTIQFNLDSDAWLDVWALTEHLKGPSQSAADLEAAVALYRGEFLEGFSVPDCLAYEEWLLLKREQFNRDVLGALYRLATIYESRGEYPKALPHAWRQLELEPWHEQAHRQVMRLLALAGQRGAALAQFDSCQRLLAQELGVEPAQETILLYEQIRDGELSPAGHRASLQMTAAETREAGTTGRERESKTPPAKAASAIDETRAVSAGRRFAGRRSAWLLGGMGLVSIVALALLVKGVFGTGKTPQQPVLASPQSGQVVLTCGPTYTEICVQYVQSQEQRVVIPAEEFAEISPQLSWSPDGAQFAFGAARKPNVSGLYDYDLYLANADGSGLHPITSGPANDQAPAWSPDGTQIVFQRNGELWVADPQGSSVSVLHAAAAGVCFNGMAWSRDSQWIAFLETDCGAGLTTPTGIRVIDRNGQGLRTVYETDRILVGGNLAWSPDEGQIACLCGFLGQEEPLLFSSNGDGEALPIGQPPIAWFHDYWPQWGGE